MIKASAAGRICLFGEHQDYLGLPVIPMAINLRVEITGERRSDNQVIVNLPDISSIERFELSKDELVYTKNRDYFKSCMNVLSRNGYKWNKGFECTVKGNIPINSGTSSSSALNSAWCKFLIEISDSGDKNISNQEIAQLNYLAEVVEFKEAGGMMDQYSTAMGGLLFIEFEPTILVRSINANPGTFVLGDSGEAKDTQGILYKTKIQALQAMSKISIENKDLNFHNIDLESLYSYKNILSDLELKVMHGMLENRDICRRAYNLLQEKELDSLEIGNLLNRHHYFLDKHLNISTPMIDRMIFASLEAGALGAKINGSGGGGCMFAYAPNCSEKVAAAIENEGGKAYIIQMGNGVDFTFI